MREHGRCAGPRHGERDLRRGGAVAGRGALAAHGRPRPGRTGSRLHAVSRSPRAASRAARRSSCSSTMRQLGVGVQSHHSAKNTRSSPAAYGSIDTHPWLPPGEPSSPAGRTKGGLESAGWRGRHVGRWHSGVPTSSGGLPSASGSGM
ncbi:MAG: DUF1559 domain-containing protein [Planctomycetia bacterium]|nr:DUF1559 domain-containing protein [Planctomycetia bacterium]